MRKSKAIIVIVSENDSAGGSTIDLRLKIESLLQRSKVFLEDSEIERMQVACPVEIVTHVGVMIKDILGTAFSLSDPKLLYKYGDGKDEDFYNQFMAALVNHPTITFIDRDQLKLIVLKATASLHENEKESAAVPAWLSLLSAKIDKPEVIVLEKRGVYEEAYLMSEQEWIDNFILKTDDFFSRPALMTVRGLRFMFIAGLNHAASAEEKVKETAAKLKPQIIEGLENFHKRLGNFIENWKER